MEWAKSKIRAHHWRVQLLLLSEEMRRSLVFVRWMAEHWRTLARAASGDSDLAEGKMAYAMKHAVAYDGLHSKWATKWRPLVDIAQRTSFKSDLIDLGATAHVLKGPVIIDVGDEEDDEAVHGDLVRQSSCLYFAIR